jgi:predicted N-acetyltransferase YhbS
MRAYISNMAVLPSARRQGLAKTLCAACGRVAKAWGEPCVLLHVASDNASAQQLYLDCGFVPVSNSQGLSGIIKGPWTQQRMVVDAGQLAGRYQRLQSSSSGSSSSRFGLSGQQQGRYQQVQA